MKNKIKFGIRAKLIIPLIIINIISFGIMGAVIYKDVRSKLIDSGRNSALSIARYTASLIETDALHNVSLKQERDDDYWSIYNTLSNAEQKSDIVYAYVVGKFNEEFKYLVVTTDTDETAFEPVLSEYVQETKKAFEKNEYCTTDIDYSEYGTLLTASVPIYASDGSVFAILQVDFDASNIVKSVKEVADVIFISCISLSVIFILGQSFFSWD